MKRTCLLLLSVAACGPAEELCDESLFRESGETGALGAPTAESRDAMLRRLYPELVTVELSSPEGAPDREHVDLVFVAEGFQQTELGEFERATAALIRGFRGDVLERARPGLFRFHRLPVVSSSSAVTNADPRDTPLGACLKADALDASRFLSLRGEAALELVRLRAPSLDALVVLVNSRSGRANAELHRVTDGSRTSVVRMGLGHDFRVLTHELGHSLFSLADEYADFDGPLPPEAMWRGPEDPLAHLPNLTVEPTGARWGGGAIAGGLRFGRGVWHSSDGCRMHRDGDSFCPVCAAHIERLLQVFEGRAPALPPVCGLRSKTPLGEVLTLEDVTSAQLEAASDLPALVWGRAGCEAPCPAVRPEFIVRAGVAWIVREPLPAGWSRREAHCAAACRYEGDRTSAPELFTAEAPEDGVVEVTCQSAAGLTRSSIPYRAR
ncbi:MAG: hypothetical protein INH41_12560 [Myxococcaceae bacterium]|nr:hypothetical protein [Myxococcaceae bacterium]MCA3013218.1 hypothetical protein [Myxococcaceae bacterium]